MNWADLTIGAECGGSDGTSGLAGNPVVGGPSTGWWNAAGLRSSKKWWR